MDEKIIFKINRNLIFIKIKFEVTLNTVIATNNSKLIYTN